MRHSIHIMLGTDLKKSVLEFEHYIGKYGDQETKSYITALHYCEDENGSLRICRVDGGEYFEELTADSSTKNDRIKVYFQRLWRARINTDYTGNDPLHFCIYVPLYCPQLWVQAHALIVNIEEQLGYQRVTIDIVGFCQDLAEVFCPERAEELVLKSKELESNVNSVIDSIVSLRRNIETSNYISNFVVMQNETNSRALELNESSMTSLLGEFAMICVENHDSVFGRNSDKKDIQALGLSMLSFDQYYFRKFLLQDAFIKLLDGEKIGNDDVSISWAAREIDLLLEPWMHLMSDMYKAEIITRRERGDLLTDILPDIEPKLKGKFEELNKQITEVILNNSSFSLPQKKGLLSILLGQDDALFLHGTLINSEQKILADLERECVNFFVDENNALLDHTETKEAVILPVYDTETGKAELPLNELKELRFKQRNYISNIREVEDELTELKKNLAQIDESKKCLIEDGKFIINDDSFQLLDYDNDVSPLEDTYNAHSVSAKNVDLSAGFTEIKNQGSQGACVSFSLLSVFEYFLKQNHESFPDLSEQFLYYNARKRRGSELLDSGSDSVNSIHSLVEDGVCTESLWPYDVTKYAVEPSPTAYKEAKIRRVKKAVMVEKNIESIKSALEDGLPVVFAVDIFPSFGKNVAGFVPMPSEDEVNALLNSQENHAHAMVFCGFNNAQRVFKVRNSWGTSFGDKGYCYISYDYIKQHAYNGMVAIQEISVNKDVEIQDGEDGDTNVVFTIKKEKRPQLNFSETDIAIKYAQRERVLYELKQDLKFLQARDRVVQTYYEAVKIPILDRNKRDEFYKSCKKRREIEIEDFKNQKIENEQTKKTRLKEYDKKTKTTASSVLTTFGTFSTTFGLIDKALSLGEKATGFFETIWNLFSPLKSNDNNIGSFITGYINGGVHSDSALSKFIGFFLKGNSGLTSKIDFIHGLVRFGWILFVILFVLFAVAYLWYRISHRKDIEVEHNRIHRDLNAEIFELEDQIATLEARFCLAGEMLKHLFDVNAKIQTRHSAMNHYLINLRVWYDTIVDEHSNMQAKARPPFVSLLRNDILEQYFENKKDALIESNNLWRFIEKYEPSEDGIVQVKQSIMDDLLQKIEQYFSKFSVADYLINIKNKDKYPYLVHDFSDICSLFDDLDRKSDIFVKYNIQDEARDAHHVMFVHTEGEDEQRCLEDELKHATSEMEMELISSPYKIVIVRKHELDRNQIIL